MVKINSSISSFEVQGIKKLAFKAGVLFLTPLLMIGTTNFFVDPAHLYKNGRFEEGMVEILASGHNIGNVGNYDDRLMQKLFIAKLKETPDIVIIGSSRSMQIGANIFLNKHVMNNSVSGVMFGDYLGILYNYDKKAKLPRRVVLAVEPWILNQEAGTDRWVSLKEDAFAMLRKLKVSSSRFRSHILSSRTANLFSVTYFQTAIKKIFEKRFTDEAYFLTDQEVADYDILHKDGTLSYNRAYRTRSVEEVEKEASKVAIHGRGPFFEFYKPDPELVRIFELVVTYLQEKDVDVVFFLPPYHPTVYKSLVASPEKRIIIEIENYYRDFAKRHHLRILGSYDPLKAGLTGKDFYDDFHPTREAVQQMFKQSW